MLRSHSLFAIVLALSFFFNGAHSWPWSRDRVIGYAMVTGRQANRLNQFNDLRGERTSQSQTGPGFYLLNKPGWRNDQRRTGNWYCAIKADKKRTDDIRKVWIPRFYNHEIAEGRIIQQNLWGENETLITDYIEWEAGMHMPDQILRFSWIQATHWQHHMNIPSFVVDNVDLGLRPKCFQTEDEMKAYSNDEIDWENIWSIPPPVIGPPL
ncbi:uncharacterized protein L3040_002386 [Drepanopeziza brunnea f. sp. 'multigermtubi']|uniref:Uncharacterized protein n=1 Tax=Marssonina brunnea f. sp. multigermtubi (strain MB_m1) TaxID=1072389 RepID=K1XGK3_MARBU|nr:uncharacterized protein MBM_01885 [Drepanopeziza brunnea f. sp. 'multigermtubi' MB_m1]EKD19933.1 hypothetical protein MBM_01885 [Drepanopeziza brunnea f. sp. 'multigermtubi' MB_m1]KAJ5050508.1 hypothetical protein L3040_002386 [Drepanopeziza brunnea f. sp. 'multigermtubi']